MIVHFFHELDYILENPCFCKMSKCKHNTQDMCSSPAKNQKDPESHCNLMRRLQLHHLVKMGVTTTPGGMLNVGAALQRKYNMKPGFQVVLTETMEFGYCAVPLADDVIDVGLDFDSRLEVERVDMEVLGDMYGLQYIRAGYSKNNNTVILASMKTGFE